ncbi:MAG: OB-fold nucleic acid binding domain-containing protein, partial [Chthoniobacterales bacterium]
AYGSAYLKVHRAAEFYACLLNNQPMGFYAPATIVKDAHRHGIRMRPVCAATSEWRCVVESDEVVRLGFCVVNGLREEHAEEIVRQRPCTSLEDLKGRTRLTKEELRTLAELGAFNCFAEHRRAALWEMEEPLAPELFREATARIAEATNPLPAMTLGERVQADYAGMSLTTGPHPMKLLRAQLPHAWRASELVQARPGATVQIAGNVICRQRPGTAKGFVFISLEDETGVSNAIVTPDLFERIRLVITEEPFLVIEGEVQNNDNVVLIKARTIQPLAHERLAGSESHDFH